MNTTTKANLFLVLNTAIWGATFPLIRNAVAHVDANLFVAARFLLAALILLPFVVIRFKNTNKKMLLGSIVFGGLNSISYISQTIGLETIHSSRSAFITGFSVILVPFLSPLFKQGSLRGLDIVCAIICLIGFYFLTGADLKQISVGDWWTLLCAVTFAVQIVYLQYLSTTHEDYKLLTFYQLLFTVPIAILFSWQVPLIQLTDKTVIIALLFCAIFATAVVYFIQTKYQKFTTASKAALIFSLEPVFASIYGYLFNAEPITTNVVVGGLMILLSLMLPSLLDLLRKNDELTPLA